MVEVAEDVYIELPIYKEYAYLLRLMVTGLAGRMNFSIEAIDDLKMAVEETFLLAMDCCVGNDAKVHFKVMKDSLEVVFEDLNMPQDDLENKYRKHQSYGLFIIEALVDKFELIKRKIKIDIRLLKKRS